MSLHKTNYVNIIPNRNYLILGILKGTYRFFFRFTKCTISLNDKLKNNLIKIYQYMNEFV